MDNVSPSVLFRQIEPCPAERYQHLDLTGLVAFAIQWLLDHDVPTTFENIVVSVFKMFPEKFAMVGYAEYPDATRVNRSLLQLGPKYRNWARGSVQKGFTLTESGTSKVADIAASLTDPHRGAASKSGAKSRTRTVDSEGEMLRITSCGLFRKWSNGEIETATVMDLLDMVGAYAYTPHRALRKRIAELQATAAHLHNDEMIEFFAEVRRIFAKTLTDP